MFYRQLMRWRRSFRGQGRMEDKVDLVGGQRVKEQRQEPRKSEVHIEETRE